MDGRQAAAGGGGAEEVRLVFGARHFKVRATTEIGIKMIKVFISWSGNRSRKIGEAIRDWLPAVLQSVRPYFTPTDIDKGARWASEIQNELITSKLGIFVITNENTKSPWLNFEAGAISNSANTAVCPLLFGVDPSDVSGPLAQFQATPFNKDEARKLITSLNEKTGDSKLSSDIVFTVFEKWWPDLDEKISNILSQEEKSSQPLRSERELIEEILAHVRKENKDTPQNSKALAEAIHQILAVASPILSASFSTIQTSERQIKIYKSIETALAFDYNLDADDIKRLSVFIESERKKVEKHLAQQKRSKMDDDIPF
jgi:hypothetical protein